MSASEKSTTNLSDHLRDLHNIISKRSAGMLEKKEHAIQSKTKKARILASMEPERYHALTITNLFVELMLPFEHIARANFRSTLLFDMPPGVKKMTPDNMKRHILELYLTTKSFTISLLADTKECAGGLPAFHLNVDLWTCKVSGGKFLGIRAYFIDRNFNYNGRLLAVKPFNPSTAVRSSARVSDILFIWVKDVLHEFNLSPADFMSATTDSGGDIQRLGNVVMGCKWDWCLSHLLNCALVEAFGTSVDPALSKNRDVRDVFARAKRSIEYVNKSHPAQVCLDEVQREHGESSLQLLSDVPQRWKSTVNLLERLLLIWKEVRLMYSRMDKPFLIEADHTLLVQLYSMMFPIADLMTSAQGSSVPEGPRIVTLLAVARQKVLNLLSPLEVYDPALPEASRRTVVAHENLHPSAQETRILLLEAIDKRFFQRYGDLAKRSGMLDLCCFLYPPLRALQYIRFLLPVDCPNAHLLEHTIRTNTEKEIRRLAMKVAAKVVPIAAEGAPLRGSVAAGSTGSSSGSRAASHRSSMEFLSLLVGTPAEVPVAEHVPAVVTADTMVDEEIRLYKERHVSIASLPVEDSLRFWRENKSSFPILAKVARAVFGFAISAAGIERDFSVGGNCLSRKRGKLDEAIVEMMLYLNVNKKDIPTVDVVQTLTNHVMLKTQLPARFCTKQFKAVRALTMSLDDDYDLESSDDDETN